MNHPLALKMGMGSRLTLLAVTNVTTRWSICVDPFRRSPCCVDSTQFHEPHSHLSVSNVPICRKKPEVRCCKLGRVFLHLILHLCCRFQTILQLISNAADSWDNFLLRGDKKVIEIIKDGVKCTVSLLLASWVDRIFGRFGALSVNWTSSAALLNSIFASSLSNLIFK